MALLVVVLAVAQVATAYGDDLIQMVQADLITLGYDPGTANGEATTKTIIAVAKFQAEHNQEPTGEITPQLAGVIQAAKFNWEGSAAVLLSLALMILIWASVAWDRFGAGP